MRTPITYYGAKKMQAKKIVEHFPCHDLYVEPMCGSAAAFFESQHQAPAVLSDINPWPIAALRAIKDNPSGLYEILPPYLDKNEYYCSTDMIKSCQISGVDILDARTMIVAHCSSFNFSPYSGAMSKNMCNLYKNTYDKGKLLNRITTANTKLQNVNISIEDVLNQLKKYTDKDTLFFLDPPYCWKNNKGSRSTPYKGYGPYEPTEEWHDEFLNVISDVNNKSKIVITTGNDQFYKDGLTKIGFTNINSYNTTGGGVLRSICSGKTKMRKS